MDWRLAGQDQAIVLEFIVDGQPVVPDASSIVLSVYDNTGMSLHQGAFTQPMGAIPTQMTAVVVASDNALASGALFEARYLRADFTVNAKPYTVSKSYRLQTMVPTTVAPQDVRALIGADHDEMPDSEIDIMEAYVDLVSAYGSVFSTALTATDNTSLAANRAIAFQAALRFLPSYQARLLKSETANTSTYERSDIDVKKLEMDLRGGLGQQIETITGVSSIIPSPLMSLTSQTDRITNSAPV